MQPTDDAHRDRFGIAEEATTARPTLQSVPAEADFAGDDKDEARRGADGPATSEFVPPLEHHDADALVASLASLAGRVEQIQAARRAAEREAADLRADAERLAREREHEHALDRGRTQELERERARLHALRTKLIDLLRDFDD